MDIENEIVAYLLYICYNITMITYTLQANRARFNQHSVSPTCLLCKNDSEDREHLILHCTAHAYIREKHLATLRLLMARHYSRDTVDEIRRKKVELLSSFRRLGRLSFLLEPISQKLSKVSI
jgi:hypothetical protein